MSLTLREAEGMIVARCSSDKAALRPRDFALVRWCRWCGSPVTGVGVHHANGDFDPYSVMVSDAEIQEAVDRPQNNLRNPRVTRWNIAFGKHIGVYKLPEPESLRQLQRKSMRLVVAPVQVIRAGNYDTASTHFDEYHRAKKRAAS